MCPLTQFIFAAVHLFVKKEIWKKIISMYERLFFQSFVFLSKAIEYKLFSTITLNWNSTKGRVLNIPLLSVQGQIPPSLKRKIAYI